MNLVFFDIECASVYKYTAKICAFGYVVCDEDFNIISKEDILINPQGKFHLTDGRGEHGLVLPYEYSDFKKHPDFTKVYGKIRALLEDGQNLVFGHATYNDVNYLNLETKRFHLPSFNFSYLDSQLMYMTSIGDFSRQFGLGYITESLNVEFTPHRAADDSYATMRVVEALCKKHGCKSTELSALLGVKSGVISNYRIKRPDSEAFRKYRADVAAEKQAYAERRRKFNVAVNRRHKIRSSRLKGSVFNFSRSLEGDIERSVPFIEAIYSNGGRYTSKLCKCTVYVCGEEDDTVRTHSAKNTQGIKVISDADLKELLDE